MSVDDRLKQYMYIFLYCSVSRLQYIIINVFYIRFWSTCVSSILVMLFAPSVHSQSPG